MIEELITSYQHLFGLDNWKIILIKPDQDAELTNAKTLADPRYNRATMTLYPRLLADQTIWDEIIVHELIHIVMAGYDHLVDNTTITDIPQATTDELLFNARENSVSQLTSIIMRIKK
jgi:hypothetical protein